MNYMQNITKENLIVSISIAVLFFCIGYLIKTFLTWGETPKVSKEIDRILDEKEGQDES